MPLLVMFIAIASWRRSAPRSHCPKLCPQS